jgi:transposase-like protein
MPVSRKKKPITSAADAATVEPSPPMLPSPQEFHAYLRTLAQSAVRTVIEAVVQLQAFKAKYGKRYPEAVRSLAEDEEHLLTFYQFPAAMHRHIQSTNAIESLFTNVRQRTDQIDVFNTETSCLAIVWATIQDIRLHKVPV